MKLKISIISTLILVVFLIGNPIFAQSEKLSVVINDTENFMQSADSETTLSFSVIILDGFTGAKELKAIAEAIPGVIKFGVSNTEDFKTGERIAYLKVNTTDPQDTFVKVLNSLECKDVKYEKKKYNLQEFNNVIRKK